MKKKLLYQIRYVTPLIISAFLFIMSDLDINAEEVKVDLIKKLEASIAMKKAQKKIQIDSRAKKAMDIADKALENNPDGSFSVLYLNSIKQRKLELTNCLADENIEFYIIQRAIRKTYEAVQDYQAVKKFGDTSDIVIKGGSSELIFNKASDWRKGLAVGMKCSGDFLALGGDEQVITLDGAVDYIETGFFTDNLPEDEKVTFSFWVKPLRSDAGIIIEGNAVGGNERWWIWHNYVDAIVWQNNGRDKAGVFASPAGSVPAGQWSHVAVTYDKEKRQAEIFVNGGLVASSDKQPGYTLKSSGKRNKQKNIIFGGKNIRKNPGGYFSLKNVAIWNYIRKADDNLKEISEKLSGDEPGLLAYWPLDEQKGNVAHDKTSWQKHGKIYEAKWLNEISEGYWLSSPILLKDMDSIRAVGLDWVIEDVVDKRGRVLSAPGIKVYFSITRNNNMVPDRWTIAEKGKSIDVWENKEQASLKYLWLKVVNVRTPGKGVQKLKSLNIKACN